MSSLSLSLFLSLFFILYSLSVFLFLSFAQIQSLSHAIHFLLLKIILGNIAIVCHNTYPAWVECLSGSSFAHPNFIFNCMSFELSYDTQNKIQFISSKSASGVLYILMHSHIQIHTHTHTSNHNLTSEPRNKKNTKSTKVNRVGSLLLLLLQLTLSASICIFSPPVTNR